MNLCTFVGNAPLTGIDPFGLTEYPSDFIGPLLPGDTRAKRKCFWDYYRGVAALIVPGQAAWDRAMDSFWRGKTADGLSNLSVYGAELALFAATLGQMNRMPRLNINPTIPKGKLTPGQVQRLRDAFSKGLDEKFRTGGGVDELRLILEENGYTQAEIEKLLNGIIPYIKR